MSPTPRNRIRIEVERLGDGRVLLQVGTDWHLVLSAADAEHVGVMLAAAGQPARPWSGVTWSHTVEDLHCPDCGHVHAADLGGICIGCPCERTA
jgi:hypothetical protein